MGRHGEGWREGTWEEMKDGNRKEKFYNYISIKILKILQGFLSLLIPLFFFYYTGWLRVFYSQSEIALDDCTNYLD